MVQHVDGCGQSFRRWGVSIQRVGVEDVWMHGCMDGCMDVWMYGFMDVWVYLHIWRVGVKHLNLAEDEVDVGADGRLVILHIHPLRATFN